MVIKSEQGCGSLAFLLCIQEIPDGIATGEEGFVADISCILSKSL
jgi:hypothetical protein